jgi:hypothetical protein
MKKALVMTVGTGAETPVSLVHGLICSIETHHADIIVFIMTAESKKKTYPEILQQYPNLPTHEIYIIDDAFNADSIYNDLIKQVRKLKADSEIVIDFTSGTKAMSAAAVLCGVRESCYLSYINGKRDDTNLVVTGKEMVMVSRPSDAFIDFEEKQLRHLFNISQFESGLSILEHLESMSTDAIHLQRMKRYKQLFEGYNLWDKFNHVQALDVLRTFDNYLIDITENKKFLFNLSTDEKKSHYLVADLLNNAKRRMQTGSYDDCVARLYRCVEMIAQFRLKTIFGKYVSELTPNELKSKLSSSDYTKYEQKFRNGVLLLGLKDDYELLFDLGEELGSLFMENKRLKDLLTKRNYSILAHGDKPVIEKDASLFYEEAEKLAGYCFEGNSERMKQAHFPTFLDL